MANRLCYGNPPVRTGHSRYLGMQTLLQRFAREGSGTEAIVLEREVSE